MAGKLDILSRHCEAEGRDPATTDRTILATMSKPAANPHDFLTAMADYAALGISTVEIMPMGDAIAY